MLASGFEMVFAFMDIEGTGDKTAQPPNGFVWGERFVTGFPSLDAYIAAFVHVCT
jgi:hypothetical protein